MEKKSKKKDKGKAPEPVKTEEAAAEPKKPETEGSLLSKAMAMAKADGISIVAALTKLKSVNQPAKEPEDRCRCLPIKSMFFNMLHSLHRCYFP